MGKPNGSFPTFMYGFTRDAIHECGEGSIQFPHDIFMGYTHTHTKE